MERERRRASRWAIRRSRVVWKLAHAARQRAVIFPNPDTGQGAPRSSRAGRRREVTCSRRTSSNCCSSRCQASASSAASARKAPCQRQVQHSPLFLWLSAPQRAQSLTLSGVNFLGNVRVFKAVVLLWHECCLVYTPFSTITCIPFAALIIAGLPLFL